MSTATADLCDVHANKIRILEIEMKSFGMHKAFFGPVQTVKVYEDNVLVKAQLAEPGEGRVLVVDGGGSRRHALLGDNLASMAIGNGWAGVVIFGVIRDAGVINSMETGVRSLGTVPIKSIKKGEGETGIPIRFGGIEFNPGDWLYADEDGIIAAAEKLH